MNSRFAQNARSDDSPADAPASRRPARAAHDPDTPRQPMDDSKTKALVAALAQIEKQFGKGAIMKLGEAQIAERHRGRLDRLARPRHRARRRRPAARPRGRDLRAGVVGQDDAGAAGRRRGAEGRRRLRLHRRRARARPGYAGKLGVNIDDLLISQPDTGEQALEIADTLVRSGARRRDRRRLGRRAGAARRDRGRDGRPADRPAGAAHVARRCASSPATIKRANVHRHLHQPDPHEDRRHVRQPGDHHRRQRAQVLRVGAPRHPPHRRDQARRGGRSATARRSRW